MAFRDPLEDCRLRLEGADAHLQSIKDQISAFLSVEPYRCIAEFDREHSEYVFKIQIVGDIPRRLSNTVGDFFHNLRSALDHLVFALSILPDGTDPPRGTEFPIFSSRESFYRLNKRNEPEYGSGLYKIRGVRDSAHRALIEGVQPHHRGSESKRHPLWVIHDFSIVDKHRKPHLALAFLDGDGFDIFRVRDMSIYIDYWRTPAGVFHDGTEIGKMKVEIRGPNPELHVNPRISYGISFDPKGPGCGDPVIDLCTSLVDFVRTEIVLKMEPLV